MTFFQASWGKNVASLTITVKNTRDKRCSVRIVLDVLNLTFDPSFASFEIDDSIVTSLRATSVTNRDTTMIVTAFVVLLLSNKRFSSLFNEICS